MPYILNIGLARQGNSNVGVGTVLREIASCGFRLVNHAIHHSGTEITVVAQVNRRYGYTPAAECAAHLATLLGQDCIAVYNPERDFGYLAGPNAAAWGEFNPAYFLMLDGSRLDGSRPAALQVAT